MTVLNCRGLMDPFEDSEVFARKECCDYPRSRARRGDAGVLQKASAVARYPPGLFAKVARSSPPGRAICRADGPADRPATGCQRGLAIPPTIRRVQMRGRCLSAASTRR